MLFADVFFSVWLGICVKVDVDRILILLLPPHLSFVPTHNFPFNTSDSLNFGHLRKVSRKALCKALRWDKVITIRSLQHHIYIIFNYSYSRFIWLNESITLVRAEKERYDNVRFCKVASGTGS